MLLADGDRPPQPLLQLLGESASPPTDDFVRADHPMVALARLATLERARLARQKAREGEWPPPSPEKSILVVVNREAWRDLVPLFATIRESMPAAGIWVCTERIAIEIYAGESGEACLASPADSSAHPPASMPDIDSSPPPNDPIDPIDPDGADEREELVLDPTELTESELRDLLELWDEFDPENDPMEGPEQP